MAVFLLVTFTAFLFENDNLITFQMVENGGFHNRTFHIRSTNFDYSVIVSQ